jgi:hypothetical protein
MKTISKIIIALFAMFALWACVKEEYNTDKLSYEVKLLGDSLYIPIATTATMYNSDIWKDTTPQGYFIGSDTVTLDSATLNLLKNVLDLVYLSPETQVDLLLKFWNTHPRYAEGSVYFLDEFDQELNYDPINVRINQAGPNYQQTITDIVVPVHDHDQVLVDMRKVVYHYEVTENDPNNPIEMLPTNTLKGQVKMRLLNGITADVRDLIEIIKELLASLSDPNDN